MHSSENIWSTKILLERSQRKCLMNEHISYIHTSNAMQGSIVGCFTMFSNVIFFGSFEIASHCTLCNVFHTIFYAYCVDCSHKWPMAEKKYIIIENISFELEHHFRNNTHHFMSTNIKVEQLHPLKYRWNCDHFKNCAFDGVDTRILNAWAVSPFFV